MKKLSAMPDTSRFVKTSDLYELAEKRGVQIDSFNLHRNAALSIEDGEGRCFIALTPNLTRRQEKAALAHELGHCLYGGFYNRYSPYDRIEIAERKATKWAIKKLLPIAWIREQIRNGLHYYWEFAEEADLPESFVKEAFEYYETAGLLPKGEDLNG